jgi:hypothetical protein
MSVKLSDDSIAAARRFEPAGGWTLHRHRRRPRMGIRFDVAIHGVCVVGAGGRHRYRASAGTWGVVVLLESGESARRRERRNLTTAITRASH